MRTPLPSQRQIANANGHQKTCSRPEQQNFLLQSELAESPTARLGAGALTKSAICSSTWQEPHFVRGSAQSGCLLKLTNAAQSGCWTSSRPWCFFKERPGGHAARHAVSRSTGGVCRAHEQEADMDSWAPQAAKCEFSGILDQPYPWRVGCSPSGH